MLKRYKHRQTFSLNKVFFENTNCIYTVDFTDVGNFPALVISFGFFKTFE